MANCQCLRCDYQWQSEIDSPRKCARCRTPLWNQARKYKLKDKPEIVPTEARRLPALQPDKLHGVTLADLLVVLSDFDNEYPVYAKELRALRTIVKNAFKG